jgi:predicted phosphodiesterase
MQSSDDSFIVIAGDLTTGHKEDMHIMKSRLEMNSPLPYFPVTGNHDLYFEGWEAYLEVFGSSTYTMEVRTPDTSDLYIFLDTGSATLGNKQTNWLKAILEDQRKQHRHCIIVTHTNFFRAHRTTSTNPLVDELYFLLDLFTDHSVDLVIMGHDHRRSVERFGPTTYITLDALLDGYKHASFLELHSTDNGITYDFDTP